MSDDMNIKAFELSPSLPNKFLNADGSITDMSGNIIYEADESRAKAYANALSITTVPNKWLDSDGEIKTLEEISPDDAEEIIKNLLAAGY